MSYSRQIWPASVGKMPLPLVTRVAGFVVGSAANVAVAGTTLDFAAVSALSAPVSELVSRSGESLTRRHVASPSSMGVPALSEEGAWGPNHHDRR